MATRAEAFALFCCFDFRYAKTAQELDKYAGEEIYTPRLPGAWGGAFAIHKSANRASAGAVGQKKLHKVKGTFEAAPTGKAWQREW